MQLMSNSCLALSSPNFVTKLIDFDADLQRQEKHCGGCRRDNAGYLQRPNHRNSRRERCWENHNNGYDCW